MTPEERAQVLGPWSGPPYAADLVRDELLHEFFEASADRVPERRALFAGGQWLSYRELEERANRLARCLRARGIGREDRVAVLLPRSEHVYVAILAILKAGAAYVPLDPETPPDRAAFILEDSGAKALLTLSTLGGKPENALPNGVFLLCLDLDAAEIAALPASRIARGETGAVRGDLCYVIYTSGTTGRPKGVQIEHRSVTNLIRAESRLCGIVPGDRILQLSSVAFDASVEEIWMAFFNGAVLVAATQEMLRSGHEFAKILTRLEISVLSCVPTFLSMLEEDVPTVRLLLLGGEVCPPDLVERWQRPGRTVLNVYGPTETTCLATAARLEPGRPVTIGRPVANYRVFVLNESFEPLPPGAQGELYIAGEGVARGYLKRPELEKEKFLVLNLDGRPLRVYRTGDLARFTAQGELEYLGRADGQVKLRGYRIELSEIESLLMQCPGVLAAAAAPHRESQRIAAYIVPRSDSRPDREQLRETLSSRLPSYMMPAFLDELAALPLTVSGKIDRQRLPPPVAHLDAAGRARVAPRNAAEREIAGIWEGVLGRKDVSVVDDFFRELDGHSLLATLMVSRLRLRPGFERVSVSDFYANPTVEKLARLAAKPGAAAEQREPFQRTSTAVYLACMAGQALGIFFIAGLNAWQWLGEYLVYGYLVVDDWPVRKALLAALAVYLVTTPAMLLLSIAFKWLLLGRIKPGRHPLWGWYYWRFWFVRAAMHAAPVHYLAGTPLMNLYYRLMGAKIGRNVFIGQPGGRRAGGLMTFDLLSVGDGSSIGAESSLDGSSVEGGMLRIAPVTVGRGCWIGNRCSIGGGAVLEDGSGLADLTMVPGGTRVPAGELWRGSPAAAVGKLQPEPARPPWSAASALILGVGMLAAPLPVIAAIFPGLIFITHLGHNQEGYAFLLLSPLVALSFILLLSFETWAFKWLLIGRLREGRYPIGGAYYLRYWFSDRITSLSLEVIGTLYTTLYVAPWLRALGARIGARTEFDHIDLQPDLFEAGPECFMAGYVMVGAPSVRSGWISFGRVKLGERSFAGASVVLPAGTVLGDDVLIGTYSIPPHGLKGPVPDGSTWFGSPPIQIPARHRIEGFAENRTFRPSRGLVALRLFAEFFHVILPSTFFIVLTSLMISATDRLQDYIGLGGWLLSLPLLYVAAGILAILVTLAAKWGLIGRFRAGEKPLWCAYVWRSEIVFGVYDYLCVPFMMEILRGTPFIAWPLRGLGMKVGRRCFIDTTWFMCADLIEIGDEAELNNNCAPMEQLYEGRIMKMGHVRIGSRCVLSAESAMQYDSQINDEAVLEELTLVMKGENLPAGTRWQGLPARPAGR